MMLKFPRILILVLLISFASISAVLFTPALPGLAAYFGITETEAQWTMSIFLIGYAVGQLPYGPIAKKYGRKKTIFFGIALATIGSLICLFATAFWVLCLGRLVQALGSAVGLKITFTMVNDLHTGPSATRALSLVMLAFGVMPGLGIAIGGFLTVIWGWKGCFFFMTIYSVILAFLCFFLPETAKVLHQDALEFRKIAHGYARQFKDSFLVIPALITGLTTALLYVFATVSPYISIETLGLTPDAFGLWSIIPALGLFLGILLTRYLAEKQSPRAAILTGIFITLLGTLAMSLAFSAGWVSSISLFFPMFIIQMGDSLIYTNAAVYGVSESSDKSNASAVMQFITMATATVSVFFIGLFTPTDTFLIPISFGLVIALMLYFWLKLPIPRNS